MRSKRQHFLQQVVVDRASGSRSDTRTFSLRASALVAPRSSPALFLLFVLDVAQLRSESLHAFYARVEHAHDPRAPLVVYPNSIAVAAQLADEKGKQLLLHADAFSRLDKCRHAHRQLFDVDEEARLRVS